MVRNLSESDQAMPAAEYQEEPFGEQYFPRQLSWYASEGPCGMAESVARYVREQPFKAVGIALAAGFAMAVIGMPAIRIGAGLGGAVTRRLTSKSACERTC